jgi:Flp pilus assembly protein TadG
MNASMKGLSDRMCRMIRELRTANGANVTIFFALSIVPMFGLVGAAVDYSQANSIKAAMQAAADSTALMLAKNIGSGKLNSNAANQQANIYFVAMLNRPTAQNVSVSATYTAQDGPQVTLGATASLKTNFVGLLGVSTIQIGVTSRVAWGGGAKLQVALALDNTGSMAEWNKIGSLKSATHALLDQLKGAASNPTDVNVAIIPFAKEVNVGTNQSNASWLSWTGWDALNGKFAGLPGSFDFAEASGIVDWNGNWPSTANPVVFVTNNGNGNGNGNGNNGNNGNNGGNGNGNGNGGSTTWVPNPHSTWNGCVQDRDQNYDVLNTSPNSVLATLFPTVQSPSCPVQMMGLSNDWAALNSLVDQMTPSGYTNQAIGLAWAWQALTPGAPMNALAKGPDVKQIIILLTDGLNTQDRWYTDQAAIDARQKLLCDNVKAADVTLYTIQVNIGNMDPVSTLLQGCASKSEYFYHLTSTGEIATVFDQIGTNMSKLRLAR